MKYIVAVSGGVDSVVLLDMLARRHRPAQLIVAHFDHGIRGEASRLDALFVEKLSQKYTIKCEIGHGNLSENASEDQARQERYTFLRKIAQKHAGQIVTAHHRGDLVETVAINLTRGTGWRGVAVFGDRLIVRPLLSMGKTDIYRYALRYGLEWVEDETNQTDAYLRNRLRRKLGATIGDMQQEKIAGLQEIQMKLAAEITQEAHSILSKHGDSRYFFIMTPDEVAKELLRVMTDGRLTRPQLERALVAIKTFRPGSTYEAGAGIVFSFTKRHLVVTNTSRVV